MQAKSDLIAYRVLAVFGLILAAILLNSKPAEMQPAAEAEQPAQQETKPSPIGQVLFIPKINVWAPVVYINTSAELEIQTALLSGVVHITGTPLPGEVGSAVIVGHASNYPWSKNQYDAVFIRLDELEIGDNITVIDYSGQTRYEVFATYLASPDNAANISQDSAGRRLLTLQAVFTIGSEEKRFTAVAELKN